MSARAPLDQRPGWTCLPVDGEFANVRRRSREPRLTWLFDTGSLTLLKFERSSIGDVDRMTHPEKGICGHVARCEWRVTWR